MSDGKVISTKQLKIDKANTTIVVVLSVASFVLVFSLFGSKALISQYSYQSRVTSAQSATVDQLKTNKQAATKLIASYSAFNVQNPNIIGGSIAPSASNKDGPNSKIILDALPNTYDFPALATSIQGLISVPSIAVNSITGTDTGSTSSTSATSATPPATTPTTSSASPATTTTSTTSSTQKNAPVPIPFSFTVEGSYVATTTVLTNIQNSIRPIQIQSIDITGSDTDSIMTVTAQTYYLPSVGLNLSTETIK